MRRLERFPNWKQLFVAEELSKIVLPYNNWENNEGEEKNQEAKNALHRFYREIGKYKGENRFYECRSSQNAMHTSYLRYLLEIREGLRNRMYMSACNGVESILYYEPFFQGRIYYNVLKLLEHYIGEEKRLRLDHSLERKKRSLHRRLVPRPGMEYREPYPEFEFENAMDIMNIWLNEETDENQQIALLDYLLSVIRLDIQTDMLTTILYNRDGFMERMCFPFPSEYYDEIGNRIKFYDNEQKKKRKLTFQRMMCWFFRGAKINYEKV